MASYRHFGSLLLAIVAASMQVAAPIRAEELTRDEVKFFETKIRPVLIRECYGCHSNKAGNVRGGLRLDTKELMHIGGGSGPAIVPGDLEESWLYNAITHQDFVMPPKRKLPQNVIDDFRKWIEMGAPDPRTSKIGKINSTISKEDIEQARQSFWAYQPPKRSTPPAVEQNAWPRTHLDRFVLAKLEQSELAPAADADPGKVLRRLSFDLVGLPPTPTEIDAFETRWKISPDQAIVEVVDRLLEKEQFGERWGRHWLDVVRYAESTGREVNMTYPQAWRYRDYVVDAFNADKSFKEFVQEQIAGDLLPVNSDQKWAKNLVATTFLAVGPKNVNEQNAVQFAADLVDEQIDATTRVFLGMSAACARCHDHKFDAIPQTDYYALAGIFKNTKTYFGHPQSAYGQFNGPQARRASTLMILPVEDPNPFDKRYSSDEIASLKREIEDKLREMGELRRNRSGAGDAKNAQRQRIRLVNELQRLSGRLGAIDESGEPRTYTMGVQDRESPTNARLLVRGEIDQQAQSVERGFPQVLCSTPVKIDSDSSGRLQLARWIGNDNNPLTARVMVNRIWQHLLGQGIVRSTENFGATGQLPSHPDLLDHLALRFIESGWSVKSMVREIAISRVYRMQSSFNKQYHEADPDNALLWRANPRRLDAEALRDAMLSISGEIDFTRPRASEVAKAGYTRVQDGRLGIGRYSAMEQRRQVGSNSEPYSLRPAVGGFRNGRPGGFSRRAGGFFQRMTGGASRAASSNPLDMVNAKYRSVYLPIVRDSAPRSLEVFDFADANSIIGTRESSNTPNQALYMLNNQFVIQQSGAFARKLAESSSSPQEQVKSAFLWAYGRPPTAGERAATAEFIREFAPTTNYRDRMHATMTALCQSLFASAEFRYID